MPIAVSLDLHANISPAMVELSDVITIEDIDLFTRFGMGADPR